MVFIFGPNGMPMNDRQWKGKRSQFVTAFFATKPTDAIFPFHSTRCDDNDGALASIHMPEGKKGGAKNGPGHGKKKPAAGGSGQTVSRYGK